MNKIVIMGRLTADPELRQTQNGVSSCRFTVAINRQFKNSDGKYDADFLNCIAWRQTAEFVSRYFKKGKMIMLVGNVRTGSYTDKNGITRSTFDIYVDNVEFCGDSKSSAPPPDYYQPPPEFANTKSETVDSILSDFEELMAGATVEPF